MLIYLNSLFMLSFSKFKSKGNYDIRVSIKKDYDNITQKYANYSISYHPDLVKNISLGKTKKVS